MTTKVSTLTALTYATERHFAQIRKYTGEPYIEHPIAVAGMVREYCSSLGVPDEHSNIAVAAALLHDVVEDTDATIEDIYKEFGPEVAEYVWYLTKPPEFIGIRAQRKLLDQNRLALAPQIVKAIKTFDLYHNSKSIEQYDPDFYKTWSVERNSLLDAMQTQALYFQIAPK